MRSSKFTQPARRGVRLQVQELHARTVPALLAGTDGDFLGVTEQSFVADDFTSTGEVEGIEVTDAPLFDRVDFDGEIMPYFRTLADATTEQSGDDLDPNAIFWTFGGALLDESPNVAIPDEGTLTDECAMLDLLPEEGLITCWTGISKSDGESQPESTLELAQPSDDILYTMTGGASAEDWDIEDLGEVDPAVCYFANNVNAGDPSPMVGTVNVVAIETLAPSADESFDLSIFSLDDFVSDDPTADTQELDLTEEICVEIPATPLVTPPSPVTVDDAKAVETTYVSMDDDLLDVGTMK